MNEVARGEGRGAEDATVGRDDEREIVSKLTLAHEERQMLVQRLREIEQYMLRLEGALTFVRGKLDDGLSDAGSSSVND